MKQDKSQVFVPNNRCLYSIITEGESLELNCASLLHIHSYIRTCKIFSETELSSVQWPRSAISSSRYVRIQVINFLPFDVVYRCQPTLAEFMSPFLDHKSFSGFICEKCCEQIHVSFDVVLVYLKQLHLSGLRASGVQDAKWLRAN